MQSGEIDLRVIYILVREEMLKTDELQEETGGEKKGWKPQSQGNSCTGGERLETRCQLELRGCEVLPRPRSGEGTA